MPRHRRLLLALAVLVCLGSIAASTGYGLFVRSDAYRRRVEDRVGAFFGLPTRIGHVEMLTRSSRRYSDIALWLAPGGEQVFACHRATWRTEPTAAGRNNVVVLAEGWFLLGTGQFNEQDYQALLASSLGRDFAGLDLGRVEIDGMDFLWRAPSFRCSVADARGEIVFDDDGTGRAQLVAHRLNDHDVTAPISIRAHFTPGAGLRFHEINLTTPSIPLRILGLDRAIGSPLTRGAFEGTLTVRPDNDEPRFHLAGAVTGAALAELTAGLATGPIRGELTAQLHSAELSPRGFIAARFNGAVDGVDLQGLAPLLNAANLAGTVDVHLDDAAVDNGRLRQLDASARAANLPMDVLTGWVGTGEITGRLNLEASELLVVDEKLIRARIRLDVLPPRDAAGRISRTALQRAAEEWLGVKLDAAARLLPESIEYTRFGCRLIVDGDRLRIQGTHGAGDRTLLTVRLFGQEIGVLKAPEQSFPLPDFVAIAHRHLREYDEAKVRRWWENHRAAPQDDADAGR